MYWRYQAMFEPEAEVVPGAMESGRLPKQCVAGSSLGINLSKMGVNASHYLPLLGAAICWSLVHWE